MFGYTAHVRPAAILHVADVHLGLGSGGAGLEEAAFARSIDFALAADVDAILIAGDLFDHAHVSDELLAWTAKELDRSERPVVLMVGNHDPLSDPSVHHRFRSEERYGRVVMLDDPLGSSVEIPGTDVVVWGRAMVAHEPGFRPLAGVPDKPKDRWGIVAGHGLALKSESPTHHASPIPPSDLASIDWDYVALGHYHGHKIVQEVPCPAVYPGSTAVHRDDGYARSVLVRFEAGMPATFESIRISLAEVAVEDG